MIDEYFVIEGKKFVPTVEDTFPVQYARMKHSTESSVYGGLTYMAWRGHFKDGANLPSCIKYPFKDEKYLFLKREQEQWWYDLHFEASQYTMSPTELMKSWRNTIASDKAFTNGSDDLGWIANEEGRIGPLRLEPIICTGATIKLTRPWNPNARYTFFEVVDMATDTWRGMTIEKDWHIIQPATSARNVGKAGKVEVINPFPKMNGGRMTPYFLWALGTSEAYIDTRWLDPLSFEVTKPMFPYSPQSVADADRWA